jgi:hypothetical protein
MLFPPFQSKTQSAVSFAVLRKRMLCCLVDDTFLRILKPLKTRSPTVLLGWYGNPALRGSGSELWQGEHKSVHFLASTVWQMAGVAGVTSDTERRRTLHNAWDKVALYYHCPSIVHDAVNFWSQFNNQNSNTRKQNFLSGFIAAQCNSLRGQQIKLDRVRSIMYYMKLPTALFEVYCVYLVTHSLTHGAEPFLRSYQLPSILWNPKVHYCVRKSPPLVPILTQINPIHTIPSYLSKIHFNLGLPSGLFPSGFAFT